ncbi:MAG: hypothetical protein KC592_15360, partial [Nitrospira sp.]|nr:hypothetical protein [Nitrospira sp.]
FGVESYGVVGWACAKVRAKQLCDSRFKSWVERGDSNESTKDLTPNPNDSDPFPSGPHGHVGSPTSNVKVDVNTGKIFNGTKPTGESLSSKGLATLRSALRNAGLLGLAIKLGELATARNASALGDILDPGFMIGGDLSGDDMLPFTGNPGGWGAGRFGGGSASGGGGGKSSN